MKTNFNIAWVDDNYSDKQMKIAVSLLTRNLKRKNGFFLIVEDIFAKFSSLKFDSILNSLVTIVDSSNSIDLVLIDYELSKVVDVKGEPLKGEDIAKRFRDALPSVDIIFYSGKKTPQELRMILAEANVDCVNCLDRGRLGEDAFTVIENVINRSCKISTLRGLVLNSVSEMDNLIVDILSKHYSTTTPAIKNAFIDKVAEYIVRPIRNNRAKASTKRQLINQTIETLLSHKKITSGSMFIYLNDIIGDLNLSVNQTTLFDKYEADILDLRNTAAHAKEVTCSTTGQAMLQLNATQYRRGDIDDICNTIVAHEINMKSILDGMV